jgi:hypothetical protein
MSVDRLGCDMLIRTSFEVSPFLCRDDFGFTGWRRVAEIRLRYS